MAKFLLRMSTDYFTTVEADDDESARKIGEELEISAWDHCCWSEVEVEKLESEIDDS